MVLYLFWCLKSFIKAFGGQFRGSGNQFWGRGGLFLTVCGAILGVGFEVLEIFGVRFGVEASKRGFRALMSQKN